MRKARGGPQDVVSPVLGLNLNWLGARYSPPRVCCIGRMLVHPHNSHGQPGLWTYACGVLTSAWLLAIAYSHSPFYDFTSDLDFCDSHFYVRDEIRFTFRLALADSRIFCFRSLRLSLQRAQDDKPRRFDQVNAHGHNRSGR